LILYGILYGIQIFWIDSYEQLKAGLKYGELQYGELQYGGVG